MSDLHCYIALKPWHDRFIVRLVYYHKDHSWKSRDKKLDEMTGTEGVKLVVIDQTSIGDKYVMDAKERKNGHKVRGVIFNNATKEELASNLARAMEAGKIIIPNHDLCELILPLLKKATPRRDWSVTTRTGPTAATPTSSGPWLSPIIP